MTSPITFDIDSKFRKGSKSYQGAEALLSGKEWTRQDLEAQFGIKKTIDGAHLTPQYSKVLSPPGRYERIDLRRGQ